MIRISTLWALALAALLASCATGYGPQGLTGGYVDEKIDDTHYRVKFSGNGHASSDRVWGFWMYRCAELTLQKGYSHFTLHRPGAPLSQSSSGHPRAMNAVYRPGNAPRMLRTKGSGGGYYYVPSYSGGYTVTTWHADAVVAMHREPLPEYEVALDAQAVVDALGPYVKSNGQTAALSRTELFKRAARINRAPSDYRFGGTL
jgi:hypothetical protein